MNTRVALAVSFLVIGFGACGSDKKTATTW
jgi:hypothetical protein